MKRLQNVVIVINYIKVNLLKLKMTALRFDSINHEKIINFYIENKKFNSNLREL